MIIVSRPYGTEAQSCPKKVTDFAVASLETIGIGVIPVSVTVGDFNGDGKQDIATANKSGHSFSVVLGDGNGGFGSYTETKLLTENNVSEIPTSIISGDFNNDGKADLAVACISDLKGTVSVLLGNGSGGFSAAAKFECGIDPNSITSGDFNGDGKTDLATASPNISTISVLLGDGHGNFSLPGEASAKDASSVKTGDFNNDGKLDIIATSQAGSGRVIVLFGDGTGDFGKVQRNFLLSSIPYSITVGDFNGDGRLDVATCHYYTSNVFVMLGDGVGGFATPVGFKAGSGPWELINNDFDGDGFLDLAVADYYNSSALVLPGNGRGGFLAAKSFDVSGAAYAIASGDFNRDGRLDLVTANEGYIGMLTSVVAVLLAKPDDGFGVVPNFRRADGLYAYDNLSATAGDFNNNGKLDLATANPSANQVTVILGNGVGGLGSVLYFNVGNFPSSVTNGDFNNDGRLDLVTANSGSNNISVLMNLGNGHFRKATNFAAGAGPKSIISGDFNLDGKPDLATANNTSGNISVLLGDGTGSFGTATAFEVGFGPTSIATGDFNNDGKPDLATSNYIKSSISVLLGNGSGAFAARTDFAGGVDCISLTTGDFNEDGKLDIATTNSGYLSNNISVLLGNGAGAFGAPTSFEVGKGPLSVTTGDFNADGKLDIATANHDGKNVSVLVGNGAGSFKSAVNFAVGGAPSSIVSGRFNNDGILDLATANASKTISMLINVCNRDLDGDGILGPADNCPTIYNPDQSDTDRDGKGNACDIDDDNDVVPDLLDCEPLNSKNKKVLICHKGKTLCVRLDAVWAHLKHGDQLGRCSPSSKVVGEDLTKASGTNLQVYPNPNNGHFTLELQGGNVGKAEVLVLNANGNVVEKRTVMVTVKSQRIQFQLTGKASGIYLIKLISAAGVQTTKVLVQR